MVVRNLYSYSRHSHTLKSNKTRKTSVSTQYILNHGFFHQDFLKRGIGVKSCKTTFSSFDFTNTPALVLAGQRPA